MFTKINFSHKFQLKDDKPDFRQSGDTLRISHVTAENSGTYVCRAVNQLSPSGHGARKFERIGNASIALLVRHRPGRARISPNRPIVAEGGAVSLTCTATPPGWPAPQYRLVLFIFRSDDLTGKLPVDYW